MENGAHNLCGPMEKSVTFTGICANEIIPSINRSFVYKAKEGGYVRITYNKNCLANIIISRFHISTKYMTKFNYCFERG